MLASHCVCADEQTGTDNVAPFNTKKSTLNRLYKNDHNSLLDYSLRVSGVCMECVRVLLFHMLDQNINAQ